MHVSDRKRHAEPLDPIETARQVHTLAQRLLHHVSANGARQPQAQTEQAPEATKQDQPVTYWYP